MKTSSAKAKGRNLQKEVKAEIHKQFPHLKEDDVTSASMGAQGEDIKLSPAARKVLPVSFECKATEKFNLRESWEQAEANSKQWNPVVVHRKNRTKPVAVCDLTYFISLHADADRLCRMVIELQAKLVKGK